MEYVCEEDTRCSDDDIAYSGRDITWYSACDEIRSEKSAQESPVIVSQLRCQEVEVRRSDLQLANKLDEIANALRTGTPAKFTSEPSNSQGQTLQEFLCKLEKRIQEKPRKSQPTRITCVEETIPDQDYSEYVCSPSSRKTPASFKPGRKPSPKRIRFSEASTKREMSRGRLAMGQAGSSPSPDWRALNEPDEILCYPGDRSMYGLTAGDVWRRRTLERERCESHPYSAGPSLPKSSTPVRQVQAIPVQIIPSPRYDEAEEMRCINTADLNGDVCGCTVEDILRRRAHCNTATSDVSRKMQSYMEPASLWLCKPRALSDKSPAEECKKRSRSRSHSNSSICCCDPLAQRIADWTECEFGPHEDKAVSTGLSCTPFKMKKPPILKKKPVTYKKKFRVKFPAKPSERNNQRYVCQFHTDRGSKFHY